MNGAEDVFELLNSHDQELTLNDLVETQKQRVWRSCARSVTVLKWMEGHCLIEPGTKALGGGIVLNQQQATTTRQRSVRTLSCRRDSEGEEGLCLTRLWC